MSCLTCPLSVLPNRVMLTTRVSVNQLYAVYMADERRRASYAQRVSYQREVGSSIDPDMEDFDAYERHFTTAEEDIPPAEEDEIDYAMIPSDGPAPRNSQPQPPPHYGMQGDEDDIEVDIEMPLSSPPPSPSLTLPHTAHSHSRNRTTSHTANLSLFMSSLLDCPCPYCSAPFSLYSDIGTDGRQEVMTCAVCTESFALRTARESWEALHAVDIPYVLSFLIPPSLLLVRSLADGRVLSDHFVLDFDDSGATRHW